jgi:hypothetical protein
MIAPQKTTLRIAYMPHSASTVIFEEYTDGSIRKVRRPKSVEAMDRKRKKYGRAWRSVRPWTPI